MPIEPITCNEDLDRATRRLGELWGAAEGTSEYAELDALATLIDAYERKHWPTEPLTPLQALRFAMEQNNATQKDFAALLGSPSRASEILNGKRDMTLAQIRRVSKAWSVPIALLVGDEPALAAE